MEKADDLGALARRGRGPSVSKTAETRARIVEAALSEFIKRGFEHSRMSDIAASAGVAKGTIYLYFSTKESLFESVLAEIVGSTIRTLAAPAIPENMSVKAFVSAAVLPMASLLMDERRAGLFRLIMAEGPRVPALLEAYRRSTLEPLLGAIQTLMQLAHERGEISSVALVSFPLLMLSPALLSTVWNGLFPAEKIDPSEMFAAFLDVAFGTDSEPLRAL